MKGFGRWWALGALAVDLRASISQLRWFSNAYTLVPAAGLPPAGLLGDRFGPKKPLIGALCLFGLGSLACAYAGSAGMLIAARAVLGIPLGPVLGGRLLDNFWWGSA